MRLNVAIKDRFSAFAYYLFRAPFIRASRAKALGPFQATHYEAAMGSWFLLLLVTFLLVLAVACLSIVMVFVRSVYEHWHLEPYLLDVVWKTFLAWVVVHTFCAVHALGGWGGKLPLVNRLGAQPLVRGFVRAAAAGCLLLLLVVGVVAAHASMLTRHDEQPGRVYMVYEDNGVVPGWIFSLGMYRMALAARDSFGPDSTILLRISVEHLRRAFREGTVVVVGSHGQAQGLIADKRWFTPNDLKAGDVGLGLRYVYLTGCDSGAQAADWQRVLRPAQVATHDRLTAVVEHIWWMWFSGPGIIREIAEKEAKVQEVNSRAVTP